jgi:DNA-binding transcriptional ArsR family regulator
VAVPERASAPSRPDQSTRHERRAGVASREREDRRARPDSRRSPYEEYALTGIFLWKYIHAVNATLTALAEPNRFRIVELLRDKPRPVGEIAKRLRLRQPQVSKHLRVLSDAGLVDVRPVAQQRIYELRSEPFDELDSWLETFRRAASDRMDRLEVLISERKAKKEREKERGD